MQLVRPHYPLTYLRQSETKALLSYKIGKMGGEKI